jgi:hypothetical protein
MVLTICVATMVFMIPLVDLLCEHIESLLFGATNAKPTAPFSWSFEPQHLDDLETSAQTQAYLPLHREKDSSDFADIATAEHTCTQQQASAHLLQPPDLYTTTWFCIGFNMSRGRGKLDHIIIVNRNIGNVCVICCLLVVIVPKGIVEGTIARMLMKQAAKLLQIWERYRIGGTDRIARTDMKMKTEAKTEDKMLGEV